MMALIHIASRQDWREKHHEGGVFKTFAQIHSLVCCSMTVDSKSRIQHLVAPNTWWHQRLGQG